MSTNQDWLDAELDRMWLVAERRLRKMQAAGVELGSSPGIHALETILATRRGRRGGGDVPSIDEIDRTLLARLATLAELRPRAPIGTLAARLGLRSLEVDVLIATLAPLVDPPLAELFLLVRGTPRRGVDLALIGELFELDRRRRLELLVVVDAERPLLRWGLLAIDGGRDGTPSTHRPLQLSPDLVATLGEDRELPPSLAPHAELRHGHADLDGLVLPEPLRARASQLLVGFAATRDRAELPWLVLWGVAGSGRRELATRIAAAAKCPTLVFDPSTCSTDDVGAKLLVAQREALIRDAMLVIATASELVPALTKALRRYPGLVAFAVTASQAPRLETDRAILEVELGALDRTQAGALWTRELARVPHIAGLDLIEVLDGFRLTPGEILGAVRSASASARALGRAVTEEDLRRGVTLRLRGRIGDLADRAEAMPVGSWD